MTSKSKKIDRLSNLPEDLLSHILSLKPTKFAIRTSILSKSWRNNWTLIRNLDFDDSYHLLHDTDGILKGVDRVLELCKTSRVGTFRIYFSKIHVPDSYLASWISEAGRLNVCELDIQAIAPNRRQYIPLTMFNFKNLTKLRLHYTQHYISYWNWPSSVNLPNLKTLDIVVYSDCSDINTFKVIHSCPILENLSLEIEHMTRSWATKVEDYNFNIPTLKRLKLTIKRRSYVNKVVLNVPNLEYLAVHGSLFHSHFIVEELSSLAEAEVSAGFIDAHLFVELLKGISKAKYLTLTIPDTWYNNPTFPEFPDLKQLKLEGYCNLTHTRLSEILRSPYHLEHLCIKKPWNDFSHTLPGSEFSNLKTMKYTEAVWDEYDAKLLKFILTNSKVLETLTVKCNAAISLKDEVRLRSELSKHPRASMNCQIHFVGIWPQGWLKFYGGMTRTFKTRMFRCSCIMP